MDVSLREQGTYLFDVFELDPVRRTLSRAGEKIQLRPLLFDALFYLVTQSGRAVGRDELLDTIWAGKTVEENNLVQTISALRRTLRDAGGSAEFIVTLPGRGYQLALPVSFVATAIPPAAAPPAATLEPAVSANPGDAPPPVQAPAPLPARSTPAWHRRPIAAALVATPLLLGALALTFRHHARPPEAFAPPPNSLAILAFDNLTGDPGQDYLADGFADELIDRLGRVGPLHVAAGMSSLAFKGSKLTATEVARRLNVSTVLEGSVRRDGPALRITARLIDGTTGFRLWGDTVDAAAGHSSLPVSDIAGGVILALHAAASPQDTRQLTLGGTGDPAALDAYLHGVQLAAGGDLAGLTAALEAFDTAINRDPSFALAHLHRGRVLEALTDSEANPDPAWLTRTQAAAEQAVRRAIELAPSLGAAHAELGALLEENHFDFAGALLEIGQARLLAPGDTQGWLEEAGLQARIGHPDEAAAAARQAVALNPVSAILYRQVAGIMTWTRDFAGAQAALRHAAQLDPATTQNGRLIATEVELGLGHPEDAARLSNGLQGFLQHQYKAIAYHALGRDADAETEMASLRQAMGDWGAMQYAEVYSQWGRTQDALAWLHTAMRLHDSGLTNLKADFMLDPIATTAGFKEIERSLNFPP